MQVRPRQLLALIVIVGFAMANVLALDGSSVGRLSLGVMPPTGGNPRHLLRIVEGPSGSRQLVRQEP